MLAYCQKKRPRPSWWRRRCQSQMGGRARRRTWSPSNKRVDWERICRKGCRNPWSRHLTPFLRFGPDGSKIVPNLSHWDLYQTCPTGMGKVKRDLSLSHGQVIYPRWRPVLVAGQALCPRWNLSQSNLSQLVPQSGTTTPWNSPEEITWITWKTKQNLEIRPFLNSRLEMWVWESGRKIDPATGARQPPGPLIWEKDDWISKILVSTYNLYSHSFVFCHTFIFGPYGTLLSYGSETFWTGSKKLSGPVPRNRRGDGSVPPPQPYGGSQYHPPALRRRSVPSYGTDPTPMKPSGMEYFWDSNTHRNNKTMKSSIFEIR